MKFRTHTVTQADSDSCTWPTINSDLLQLQHFDQSIIKRVLLPLNTFSQSWVQCVNLRPQGLQPYAMTLIAGLGPLGSGKSGVGREEKGKVGEEREGNK